jgi:hypothetical protein
MTSSISGWIFDHMDFTLEKSGRKPTTQEYWYMMQPKYWVSNQGFFVKSFVRFPLNQYSPKVGYQRHQFQFSNLGISKNAASRRKSTLRGSGNIQPVQPALFKLP